MASREIGESAAPLLSVLGCCPSSSFFTSSSSATKECFSSAEQLRACTHAEQEGCRERLCSKYRVLIEMPSVTTLAFNYLSCWQLEVEASRKKEERQWGAEGKTGQWSDVDSWPGAILSKHIPKNTHSVSTVRIIYIFEKKSQLKCLMNFRKSPLGTYRSTTNELLKWRSF